MTLEERRAAFEKGVNELEKLYGITIIPGIVTKQMGEHVLIEPVLKLKVVSNWKPPEGQSDNG